MSERLSRHTTMGKVDRYLRREDTVLAHGVKALCSLSGTEYRTSKQKRAFELTLATPLATLSIPLQSVLGILVKMEDGGDMYFSHQRVGKGGEPVMVQKLRTMRAGSDTPESFRAHQGKYADHEDPRTTKIGRQLRRLGFDEIPQLLQVLSGELSLIDMRCVSELSVARLQEARPETFDAWYRAYTAGKPGIVNLYSAMRDHHKRSDKKYHYDLLYAKKASLGTDLYILFRTAAKKTLKGKGGRSKEAD